MTERDTHPGASEGVSVHPLDMYKYICVNTHEINTDNQSATLCEYI